MVSISINNIARTQLIIDDFLYELPCQVDKVIQLSELLFFHCNPRDVNAPSLFCLKEKSNDILWSMKDVSAVYVEIPENKKTEDFISNQHFQDYVNKFKNKKLLSVYVGEFRKIIDANEGRIISTMEVR